MRFVTFAVDGKSRPGVLSGQTVSDLSTAGFGSLLDFIESGPQGRTAAEKLAGNGGGYPLDKVKLLAPIPRPRKLICVGLNYRDHASESGHKPPDYPTLFARYASSLARTQYGLPKLLPHCQTRTSGLRHISCI